MSDVNISNAPAVLPAPRAAVSVRPATIDDLPFIDGLQKQHTQMVGWMPTKQLEGKVKAGHVIIAEDKAEQAVGYCIGSDQYFKRDDVGIIYQLNVLPTKQRGLIGATLIKAMFDRAAYGCRLFCCWCAQDIEANRFWESLGFIPLAFRAGSRGKQRVHIFWQRHIRAGDDTTPYWFPSQTSSGSIREDRLVFPIPPGTHWSDAKPIVLPTTVVDEPQQAALTDKSRARTPGKRAVRRLPSQPLRGFVFQSAIVPPAPAEKPKPEKRQRVKNDPKYIAAARELRDRWLERVNASGGASILMSSGKYDVGRALESASQRTAVMARLAPQLPAPAIAA
jgi:N-acetylglutamate synthase-like GNAT family acetyltransferase